MIYESFNGHSYPHESSLRSRRSKFTVRGNTRRAFFGPRASGDSDHFILEFFKNLLMSTPILIRAHVGVIPEAQERRSNEFSLVYHYAATKGLVHLDLPRKIIGLYCDLLFTCLVFVSIKPRKQTHVREGEIARCFLIYVICIFYVCVHSHQKLVSRAKVWYAQSTSTPDFEYSPTRFSKKFVFPCRLVNHFHAFKWISDFVMATASEGD